jgi:hypothetical protein
LADDNKTERVYVNMTPELKEKLRQSMVANGRSSLSADALFRLEKSFRDEETKPKKRRA